MAAITRAATLTMLFGKGGMGLRGRVLIRRG
jgi:hypothetical protein